MAFYTKLAMEFPIILLVDDEVKIFLRKRLLIIRNIRNIKNTE